MLTNPTTTKRNISVFGLALGLVGACASVEPGFTTGTVPLLTAKHVRTLPDIDGSGYDAVWKSVQRSSLKLPGVWGPSIGTSSEATLQAVYTDTHIAFLVRWQDATRDDRTHKPWVWNAAKSAYEQGREQEDAMALAFELRGPFTADMLSPVEAVWDLWTWKATRSDPVGYALDKTHRYSMTATEGKSKSYPSRTGAPVWIQRPDDAGEPTQKSLSAPSSYRGDTQPGYLIKEPSGSAADVRAKGKWENGFWTVELVRKLDTGHSDDTAFDPARRYKMALAVQDRTGDMDKSSGVILLSFERK